MARIVSNVTLNMDSGLTFDEITDGTVTTATSTRIVAVDGNRTLTVNGTGITYDASGLPSGGVINSASLTVAGVTVLQVTQGSVQVTTMRNALISGNYTAFKAELLAGADEIYGANITGASDVLFGLGGNDSLFGRAGNDTLRGDDGNDKLDGGLGVDRMEGGAGNDTFYANDRTDLVIEGAGRGTDQVYASTSYQLAANVETLRLTDAAVNAVGNSGANNLFGNDIANTLNGGAGIDKMFGGKGNDLYIVDHSTDRAYEAAGEGLDIVRASVSYNATGQHIERIELVGSAAANVIGNSLNNTIVGNAGVNGLDGGAGADRMAGGLGNDVYQVDTGGDVIIEKVGQGADQVRATVTHTLAANVENLTLEGSGAASAIGNALDNIIFGNGAANALAGLGGRDTLTGGGGADRFVFKSVSDSTFAQYDRIADLQSADTIDLSVIDANTTAAGNQSFSLVAALTGAAGQMTLIYSANTGFTTLAADVNGDGVADMRIAINGDHDQHANFVF